MKVNFTLDHHMCFLTSKTTFLNQTVITVHSVFVLKSLTIAKNQQVNSNRFSEILNPLKMKGIIVTVSVSGPHSNLMLSRFL